MQGLEINCCSIRQQVKLIKNAINPLTLDQKSTPFFQKYNAKCNIGIIVNLCYYKCASFPLLCFYIIGKIYYSVLYNIFSHCIDFLLLIQSRSNIKGDCGIKFNYILFFRKY